MKKFRQIAVIILVFIVTQTITFAQDPPPPTDFGTSSTPDETNATDAPIDAYIWVLLIIGLSFVFYKYRSHLKLKSGTTT
jgi:hypothetical protein